MSGVFDPVGWRWKTPHGYVIGKTKHARADEAVYSQEAIDTLRAQLEAAEAELATHRRDRELYVLITTQEADQWQSAEARAEAAEARCARISEAIDLAFDAAASDLEANKAEYEFDHINGAYYGLCLMRMEINKARTKEQQA